MGPVLVLFLCRMECLIAMQKYSDCMGVIEREVSEDQDNPDLYVIRAQLNVLFGQVKQIDPCNNYQLYCMCEIDHYGLL